MDGLQESRVKRMRTIEEIIDLYKQRQTHYGPLHSKMKAIQEIYNGSARIPLPDSGGAASPATPNLLAQGVDQMAGRITSVTPAINFASLKPGVRQYDRQAITASKTIEGWWQEERLPMKMKQRGRHLIAYAMSPVIVRWDFEDNRPYRQVRHPMETFPSTDLIPGRLTPTDCIFAYRRSVGWLREKGYGHLVHAITGEHGANRDGQVHIIEYVDAQETVLVAASYMRPNLAYENGPLNLNGDILKGVVLERYTNVGDECPVVIPTRVGLDDMIGQYDNMIGMYYQQARLMALELIAVEKGIFPDTYLVSRAGETARFLDGPHDGRTGLVNVVAGGDIREVQSQPGYMTNPLMDRLERNQRVTAGLPSEFGGESGSNIRTGRRGDAVLSAVIDYPIAEAQEAFAFALQEENEIAIDLAKKWDGDNPRTIYVGTGNSARPVTYTANKTFENDEHTISYPASGTDLNSLIIGIGQRVGLGIMSKRTAATLDPYIDNPEVEHDSIIAEGLEQALVSGIQQQAASGQIPPLTLAKIMTLVKNDKMELAEAMNKVTEDALKEQQRQQQEQAAAQATAESAGAGPTVQAMAGGQAAIAGPEQSMPSMQNLGQMLGALRRPGMTVAQMRGVAQGAV